MEVSRRVAVRVRERPGCSGRVPSGPRLLPRALSDGPGGRLRAECCGGHRHPVRRPPGNGRAGGRPGCSAPMAGRTAGPEARRSGCSESIGGVLSLSERGSRRGQVPADSRQVRAGVSASCRPPPPGARAVFPASRDGPAERPVGTAGRTTPRDLRSGNGRAQERAPRAHPEEGLPLPARGPDHRRGIGVERAVCTGWWASHRHARSGEPAIGFTARDLPSANEGSRARGHPTARRPRALPSLPSGRETPATPARR
jgi:hypothetical protein